MMNYCSAQLAIEVDKDINCIEQEVNFLLPKVPWESTLTQHERECTTSRYAPVKLNKRYEYALTFCPNLLTNVIVCFSNEDEHKKPVCNENTFLPVIWGIF